MFTGKTPEGSRLLVNEDDDDISAHDYMNVSGNEVGAASLARKSSSNMSASSYLPRLTTQEEEFFELVEDGDENLVRSFLAVSHFFTFFFNFSSSVSCDLNHRLVSGLTYFNLNIF